MLKVGVLSYLCSDWGQFGGVISYSRDVGSASVFMLISFFGFCVACAQDVGC